MQAAFEVHRFTVQDWQQMGMAGLFAPDTRVELIEGEIADMAPIGSEHSGCGGWLNNELIRILQSKALVVMQNPLRLGDFSEPVPDVLVLRPRNDAYRRSHPQPADVLLLIEVAETSLKYDREIKAPLYARYGVADYWLVNLPERCIEVYRNPQPSGYAKRRVAHPGETLQALLLPDLQLAVDAVLGI